MSVISGDAGEHQRQRAGDVGDRAQVALADHLGLETVFDAMGVPDHTDHGPSHRRNSAVIVLCKNLPGWAMITEDNACAAGGGSISEGRRGAALLFSREGLGASMPSTRAIRPPSAVAAESPVPVSQGNFAGIARVTGSPRTPPKSSGQNPFGTTSAVIPCRR